jgi:hypothetical protein
VLPDTKYIALSCAEAEEALAWWGAVESEFRVPGDPRGAGDDLADRLARFLA